MPLLRAQSTAGQRLGSDPVQDRARRCHLLAGRQWRAVDHHNRQTQLPRSGQFGLRPDTTAVFADHDLNAIPFHQRAITRHIKRQGKVWIRIFPHKPTTSRPPETRMGKGKGAPEHWVAVVRPGHMLFEVSGVSETLAREAMRRAANKLGIRTRFVKRDSH